MKRFELGGITVRIGGEEEYTKSEILKDDKDFKIIKRESDSEKGESRYVYSVDDQDIVFIRGDKEDNTFHITRIENATEDGVSGKFLPLVFSVMEEDLKKQGITRLTTNALTRLAPILTKRYGFRVEDGSSQDELRQLAEENKYGKAVGLIKDI